MSNATNPLPVEASPAPGGFAQIPLGLVKLWPHFADHHRLVLVPVLSFMPNAFPKHEKIGQLIGRHRNSVMIAVNQLVSVGLFVKASRYRPNGGGRTSNLLKLADVDNPAVHSIILNNLATMKFDNYGNPLAQSSTVLMPPTPSAQSSTVLMVEASAQCSIVQRAAQSKGVQPLHSPTLCSRTDKLNRQEGRGEGADAPSGVAASSRCAPGSSPASLLTLEHAERNAMPTESESSTHIPAASNEAVEIPAASESEWVELDDSIVGGEWEDEDWRECGAPWLPVTPTSAGANGSTPAASEPAKATISPTTASSSLAVAGKAHAVKPKPAPKAKRGGGKTALTDEDKQAICSTAETMARYLNHGIDAVHDLKGEYPAGPLNWRQFTNIAADDIETRFGLKDWGVQQFVGWYWFTVTNIRVAHGSPITLPNFGRLGREMKTLLESNTKLQIVERINMIAQCWDVIRFTIGKAGRFMSVNETTLSHSLVQTASQQVREMAPEQREYFAGKVAEEWGDLAA